MTITLTGIIGLPHGGVLANSEITMTRIGKVVSDGTSTILLDKFLLTTNGSGVVSGTAEAGSYIASALTNLGRIEWEVFIAATPSTQSFEDCVAAVPDHIYSQTELAILAGAGLITYTTSAEGIANTTNGQFFIVPASPMGLTIFENVAGVATVRGGLLLQQLLSNGTLALPGIAFASDTNTGIHRPAADSLAFVTGGVQRMLLNNAGLLTGPVVTQTADDTTAGRLMKVGDFGLGGGMSAWTETFTANIDDALLPGGFAQTTAGTSGTFPAGENQSGQLLTMRFNSTTSNQLWMSVLSDTLYSRRYRLGVFSPWQPLFSRKSVLGPVSQALGVPTGAVIERGSNANGEYVRFADGTQICTITNLTTAEASTAFGSLFVSGQVTWTFPATFAAAPVVSGSISDDLAWLTFETPTTANVITRNYRAVSDPATPAARVVAHGRWF